MPSPLPITALTIVFATIGMLGVFPLYTYAQQEEEKEEVSTFCGASAGYQQVTLAPITSGPNQFVDPPVAFPTSYGPTFGVEAGARVPFGTSWGLNTGIGFSYSNVSMITTQPGWVSPRNDSIPVTLEETLDMAWYSLALTARLEWTLGRLIDVQLGAGAVFPASITALAREAILEPPDATYNETDRERQRFDGVLVTKPALMASLRVGTLWRITSEMDILPFVELQVIPTSIGSQVDLKTAAVSVGAQLRLATSFFVEPNIEPVILTAPRIPPELMVNKDRHFDTPLPEISMLRKPYLATAVQVQLTGTATPPKSNADIVVRVLNCLRLRLAQENIDPEATIWDETKFELIHKDSILDATPPTAIIRVRSTAEAGVASGTVRATSGGALAFEDKWELSTDTVFAWPMRELPVTALVGDTTTISIQSTVVDHFTGESVSIPQEIVVIRSRPSKRSALVPDLVTADFTPRTFSKGTDDLSKAGRGLVAALTDHAREARVMRFRGSLAKCKRVLLELAPTGNVRVEMPEEDDPTAQSDTVVLMIER